VDATPELTRIGYQPRRAPGEGGGGEEPAPEPPATPVNVSFTQENPGDAVVGNADAVTGATLYRIYMRPAGSSDDPTLVASAAPLPTSFTIPPNDHEFTMTAGNDDGESDPTAPVTLTVA
jgi:hypothetical protein